jgi:hypothetical protein
MEPASCMEFLLLTARTSSAAKPMLMTKMSCPLQTKACNTALQRICSSTRQYTSVRRCVFHPVDRTRHLTPTGTPSALETPLLCASWEYIWRQACPGPYRFAVPEKASAAAASLQCRLRANNRRGRGGGNARNTLVWERNLSITITRTQSSTV